MNNMQQLSALTNELYDHADLKKRYARPNDVLPAKRMVNGKIQNGEWIRLPKHSTKAGKRKNKDGNYVSN